jgi:hypothetical protein
MGEEVVLVANILKEVNLVFALEESSGNAMHYCVSPALNKSFSVTQKRRERVRNTCLIIEASRSVEVVEELCICFCTPEIHIGDFKIAPDLTLFGIIRVVPGQKEVYTHSDTGYRSSRHR